MKKILALLLVLVMLLSAFVLVSCSKSEDDDDDNDKKAEDVNKDDEKDEADSGKKTDAELLVGNWEADFEFSEVLDETLTAQLGDMADYFTFENLSLKWKAEFTDKGKITMYIDEDSAEAMFAVLQDQFYEGMKKYTIDLYNSSLGVEVTFEQILTATNMTEESFKQQILASLDKDDILGELDDKSVGHYEIKDGKLFIDEEEYSYSLSGDKFEIKEYLGDDDTEKVFGEMLFPLEFTRKG